mmetsp:Transcript_6366/g.10770  ORF Transcript_6366/g.10770 Transcript_6366/m.10770 type:complete len:517 (-) Transcript_6366:18-1568(-)
MRYAICEHVLAILLLIWSGLCIESAATASESVASLQETSGGQSHLCERGIDPLHKSDTGQQEDDDTVALLQHVLSIDDCRGARGKERAPAVPEHCRTAVAQKKHNGTSTQHLVPRSKTTLTKPGKNATRPTTNAFINATIPQPINYSGEKLLLSTVYYNIAHQSRHRHVPLGLNNSIHAEAWTPEDALLLAAFVWVLLFFDFFLKPRFLIYSTTSHLIALAFMLTLSLLYWFLVWMSHDWIHAVAWETGFVMECALSIDNLFVFHMIFKTFSVPDSQVQFAMSTATYVSCLLRSAFIFGFTWLFDVSDVLSMAIGVLIFFNGILALGNDAPINVNRLLTVRFFKWLLGPYLEEKYDQQGRLFTHADGGQMRVTLLFLVTCIVPVVDCLFSFDSMCSKAGEIPNVYINLSSTFMAMMCLRALFFVVRDMADQFELLKYGIACILCFVGFEMFSSRWIDIPLGVMSSVIGCIFLTSVVASIVRQAFVPQPKGLGKPEHLTATDGVEGGAASAALRGAS